MRRILLNFAVLAVAGLIPAYAAAQQQAAATPATEAKVGLGVEKMEITGAADSFKVAPDTRIYGWARVKGVEPGSNVSLVFTKGDKEVYKKEVTVPSVPYRINAYRTFRAGDAGDWRLSVTGPDGKELASAPFKVEISK